MEQVNIQSLGVGQTYQSYAADELSLITTTTIIPNFGLSSDYVEYFIKDLNGAIVAQNYNASKYLAGNNQNSSPGLTVTTINLDPEGDARANNVTRGSVTVKYNFFRGILDSRPGLNFWIKEISPSRTEIKVGRQDLSNSALLGAFNSYNINVSSLTYYPDFLLNFGQDIQIIGVNVAYTEEDGISYLLIKLYEPLPYEYGIYSQFWTVERIANSVEYQVTVEVIPEQVVSQFALRGPNYKIRLNDTINQTTPYYNYTNLLTTSLTSTYQQLQSLFDEKAVDINVDYSSFENFIHFSSATERLLNFRYKAALIESYQNEITAGSSLTTAPTNVVTTTNETLQQNIDNIIKKFDGYEYYLYFESSSTSWPKQNDDAPYQLYSVTSSQVLDWLGSIDTVPTVGAMSMLYSASLYDNLNKDNLEYSMPAYIREDEDNEPYMVFLNMIGQHFDNIWIYYKDLSNRFSAENDPNTGISLDLVANALRGFGISLYTNTNLSDNIYYSLLGLNETGSTLPVTSSQYAQVIATSASLIPPAGNDYLSQSVYLPPFGNEFINEYVTTLELVSLPPNQLEKEIYKRIYHNLPYLLKTKGTARGIKALIACYGIPNSVLTVNEFGGYDMFVEPGIQQIQNQKVFTGSLTQISGTLLTPWTTNQYYNNNTERGSIDVEIGFSPADSINAHITGTLGNFNIMQYIGSPALQYSSSYDPLDALKTTYFNTYYTSRYNVWDFIRLIKFYNNSLFKMVRDFVPARASLTSGIIVKSHILERNKYARHEPVINTFEYSQSIDTAFITASNALNLRHSSSFTETVQTLSGSAVVDNVYGWEPYTGRYSGSTITADFKTFEQVEVSEITTPITTSVQGAARMFTTYSLNYLFQNVSGSVISNLFYDLDYNSNQLRPVNYGLVTYSIDNRLATSNPYAQFAYVQDYNYFLRRSIIPRYSGSRVSSLRYNTYTSASGNYPGDSSYGKTAAIDRNSYKLGWVKNIPSKNLNFFDKTTINLKYLIDSEQQTTDLNSANLNLFEVQNIFKSGDTVNVSISDVVFPSRQASLNGTKTIFRGGYRYDPVLYREGGETITFTFNEPISSSFATIDVKARGKYNYTYESVQYQNPYLMYGNQDPIIGPERIALQTTNPTAWTFNSDDPDQAQATSVFQKGYYSQQWYTERPSYATNQLTNWDTGSLIRNISPYRRFQGPGSPTLGSFVYQCRQLRFDTVLLNTEPTPNVLNTVAGYVYTVPRTGNNYAINLTIPIDIECDNQQHEIVPGVATFTQISGIRQQICGGIGALYKNVYNSGSVGFKVFAAVEVSNNANATDIDWQPIAVSRINLVGVTGDVSIHGSYNLVAMNSVGASMQANLTINQTGIALSQNQYLRVQVYLVAHTNIWGGNISSYNPAYSLTYNIEGRCGSSNPINNQYNVIYQAARKFNIQIGGSRDLNQAPIQADRQSTILIRDVLATIQDFYYSASYSNTTLPVFQLATTDPYAIDFNQQMYPFFESQSIFTPDPASITTTHYTEVIDYMSIQPYDVIRFGQFNNRRPAYFTVRETSSYQKNTFSLSGTFLTAPPGSTKQTFQYSFAVFNPGDLDNGDVANISVTIGSTTTNINTVILTGPYTDRRFIAAVDLNYPPGTSLFPAGPALVQFVFPSKKVRVKTFEILSGSVFVDSNNFAILRPKPDETTVIVNHIKAPGEVAQTMIIPQDASTTLLDNVGTIYESLNQSLS